MENTRLAELLAASQSAEQSSASATPLLSDAPTMAAATEQVAAFDTIDEGLDIADMTVTALDTMEAKAKESGGGGEGAEIQLTGDEAAFAAEFWNDELLPLIVEGIGSLLGIDYEFKKSKTAFQKRYKSITQKILESGKIKMPSPETVFYILTAMILIQNGIGMYRQKRKQQAKDRKLSVSLVDESRPIENIPESKAVVESRSHIENEKRRGKFNIDVNGFYTYTMDGVYIPTAQRSIKPSLQVESLIKQGLKGSEIKERIK